MSSKGKWRATFLRLSMSPLRAAYLPHVRAIAKIAIDPFMERSESDDFSLARGGPADALFQWTGLADKDLHRAKLRILVIVAIAWLPLLILSFIDPAAHGGDIKVTFLNDYSLH